MTNYERFRRHIGDTEVCPICKGGIESILHVLRDCPAMAGVWLRIVPRGKQPAFFAMFLLEWLFVNLSDEEVTENGAWSTVFAVAIWWAWKWRCGDVFGDKSLWRDRVKFVKDYAKGINSATTDGERLRHVNREARLISWTPPMVSWSKLNTDGVSHGNPGLATAGGSLETGTDNGVGASV